MAAACELPLGMNHRIWRCVPLQGYGLVGITDIFGQLKQEWQWLESGSVGRTGWEDEKGELLSR